MAEIHAAVPARLPRSPCATGSVQRPHVLPPPGRCWPLGSACAWQACNDNATITWMRDAWRSVCPRRLALLTLFPAVAQTECEVVGDGCQQLCHRQTDHGFVVLRTAPHEIAGARGLSSVVLRSDECRHNMEVSPAVARSSPTSAFREPPAAILRTIYSPCRRHAALSPPLFSSAFVHSMSCHRLLEPTGWQERQRLVERQGHVGIAAGKHPTKEVTQRIPHVQCHTRGGKVGR